MLGRKQDLVQRRGDFLDSHLYCGCHLVKGCGSSKVLLSGFPQRLQLPLGLSTPHCFCLWLAFSTSLSPPPPQLLTLSVSLLFTFPKIKDLCGSISHP